jgi:DNA-binding NarL/FixJ family response regulator
VSHCFSAGPAAVASSASISSSSRGSTIVAGRRNGLSGDRFPSALRDGIAAARRTRQIKPDIRVIAYAVRETKEDVIAWAEAGVIGYVSDTAPLADLTRLIMDIHGGEQPCSGRVAAELLHRSLASLALRRS